MFDQLSPNVERMVRQLMASGQYTSEEALLIEALESLEASNEDVCAVEEALSSLEEDPGVSVDEAFDHLRKRHGLPERQ